MALYPYGWTRTGRRRKGLDANDFGATIGLDRHWYVRVHGYLVYRSEWEVM